MHILFVSPEVTPYAKTGGLADVVGILPKELTRLGHNCSILLPLYRAVGRNNFKPAPFKKDLKLRMGAKDISFSLYSLKEGGVNIYFIRKDEYFDRDHLYGTPHGDYPDNALRFGFFSKAAISVIPYIDNVDILHLNDWQTALIPFYLKHLYKDNEAFSKLKTVFSIHNLAYQGLFDKGLMGDVDLPEHTSFMKAGILYADAISTVSASYAREILTPEFGCGLEGFLRERKSDLYGILNGVDYSVWDPAKDKFIIKNYSPETLGPKLECKKDLLREFGIKFDRAKPLIGMITRLAWQKGVDLAAEAMEQILALGTNFLLLGTGDQKYISLFKELEKRHKNEIGIRIDFDETLAHKIEAGADMFLIPSRYEPCGLNQMYSLKYATVPIVRAVGGLDDTIEEFDPAAKKGNGFKFKEQSSAALLEASKKAVGIYKQKGPWNTLLQNCMAYDFSWRSSAEKYSGLYRKIQSN